LGKGKVARNNCKNIKQIYSFMIIFYGKAKLSFVFKITYLLNKFRQMSHSDVAVVIVSSVVIFYIRKRTIAGKKVGHQISVSFEKFDIVQALLSFFLTLFYLTV
jgi:hypothetical protein